MTGAILPRVREELERDFDVVATPVGADGILSLIDAVVDDVYLGRAGRKLRVVANYGVGVDNIDLQAAAALDVVVTNTPDVLMSATAEFTIALTLALLRRVVEGDRLLRRGESWKFSVDFMLGESLDGKVFGVIGAGRIGRHAGRLAEALGAVAQYCGRGDSVEALLRQADVVSLHCPLSADTHHLIGRESFEQMRESAVLVNTARGPIVDEAALVDALRNGSIAGAALDVHEFEPSVASDLLGMENVVVTPHLGSATRTTREAMGLLAVEGLRDVLIRQREPQNRVMPG